MVLIQLRGLPDHTGATFRDYGGDTFSFATYAPEVRDSISERGRKQANLVGGVRLVPVLMARLTGKKIHFTEVMMKEKGKPIDAVLYSSSCSWGKFVGLMLNVPLKITALNP